MENGATTMERVPVVQLSDLELFADCSRDQLRQIASLTTYVELGRDRVLMREGAPAKEFIVIGSGAARITKETDEGATTVAEVGSGGFIGEMGLLNNEPRTATATAATDLGVFVSSASEFKSILQIAPSVARKVRSASLARTTAALDEAA
jgi:protein lysine acetyltransferase